MQVPVNTIYIHLSPPNNGLPMKHFLTVSGNQPFWYKTLYKVLWNWTPILELIDSLQNSTHPRSMLIFFHASPNSHQVIIIKKKLYKRAVCKDRKLQQVCVLVTSYVVLQNQSSLNNFRGLQHCKFISCSYYMPTEGWRGALLITVTWGAGSKIRYHLECCWLMCYRPRGCLIGN